MQAVVNGAHWSPSSPTAALASSTGAPAQGASAEAVPSQEHTVPSALADTLRALPAWVEAGGPAASREVSDSMTEIAGVSETAAVAALTSCAALITGSAMPGDGRRAMGLALPPAAGFAIAAPRDSPASPVSSPPLPPANAERPGTQDAHPEGPGAQVSASEGVSAAAVQPGPAEPAIEQPLYELHIDEVAYPCKILTELGKGGCGQVDCAQVDCLRLGIVALKRSLPEASNHALVHEADVLVGLPIHPNIVTLKAYGKQILHIHMHYLVAWAVGAASCSSGREQKAVV